MKALALLIVLGALFWLLRGSWRRMRRPGAGAVASKAPQPLLSTCAQCGTHLPVDEALPGRGGVFCDAAHREAYERAHPGA